MQPGISQLAGFINPYLIVKQPKTLLKSYSKPKVIGSFALSGVRSNSNAGSRIVLIEIRARTASVSILMAVEHAADDHVVGVIAGNCVGKPIPRRVYCGVTSQNQILNTRA